MHYADLPITAPPGAGFAYAMLAARTQSDLPGKADEIFIALSQGGRVFVANTKEFEAVGPIAACEAIRNDLEKTAADAANANDPAAQDNADALSAQSDAEFLKCFAAAGAATSRLCRCRDGRANAARPAADRTDFRRFNYWWRRRRPRWSAR